MAGPCEPGDVLGAVEGDFAVVGAGPLRVATEVVERLLGGGGELVTLSPAPTARLASPRRCAAYVEAQPPGVDVVVTTAARSGTRSWWRWSEVVRDAVITWDDQAGRRRGPAGRRKPLEEALGLRRSATCSQHYPRRYVATGELSRPRASSTRASSSPWSAEVVPAHEQHLPGPSGPADGLPHRGASSPTASGQARADLLRQVPARRELAGRASCGPGTVRHLRRARSEPFSGRWQLTTRPRDRRRRRRATTTRSATAPADQRPDARSTRPAQKVDLVGDRAGRRRRARPSSTRCPTCSRPECASRARPARPPTQALRWIHRPDDREQAGRAPRSGSVRRGVRHPDGAARRRRRARGAAGASRAPAATAACSTGSTRGCRSTLTGGQREVGEEIARRPGQRPPDAPAAAGRGRLRQDRRGAAGDAAGRRLRRPGGAAGPDRGARPAAPPLDHRDARRPRRGRACSAAPPTATRVALLTGSMAAAARRQALLDAASGEAGIVVGTHALLEEQVQFADLGLVVVDEQHRFGVEQRAALTGEGRQTPPHVLVMTATPIPRTVAMTVFGDLETSTLTELPAGRAPIQTTVVPLAEQPGWLDRVWARVREEVAAGPPGVRRLPADRRRRPRARRQRPTSTTSRQPRRGGRRPGRAARGGRRGRRAELADGPLAGLRRRRAARPAAARGEGRGDARLRGRRDRRARRHDRHRGRRRRRQRHRDGDPRRRPVRRLPAAPAARPGRPRRPPGPVPAGHRRRARSAGPASGSTRSPRRRTASSSPSSTSSCAARATCSGPAQSGGGRSLRLLSVLARRGGHRRRRARRPRAGRPDADLTATRRWPPRSPAWKADRGATA